VSERIVVAFHEDYSSYDLGEGHPYRGDRFVNVKEYFREYGLLDLPQISLSRPQPATKNDLLMVHDEEYINKIFHLAEVNKPYDIETPVSSEILKAALLIVGGAIMCGSSIFNDKAKRGISLGGGFHHAGRNYGGGFCLFNDIAVLVEHLRRNYGLKRFLIVDYDVHFGNGTSDIYYKDPTVLFISVHQDPHTIYPGTGFTSQTGDGEGQGYNVNIALPPGTGDDTYLSVVNNILTPLTEEFKPEILIANGGSDPHFADVLGSLRLTVNGFFKLSSMIRKTADKNCEGKLVLMPGSGYNPEVLPPCWYALAAGVVGLDRIRIKDAFSPPHEPTGTRRRVENTINELKRLLKDTWKCFR
jgi:acetoin utilization protein AcuC